MLGEEGVIDGERTEVEETDARAAGRRAKGEANLGDQFGEESFSFVDYLYLYGKVGWLETNGSEGVDVWF